MHDVRTFLSRKGTAAISISHFAWISDITRNTLEDFMWKCRWNIRWRKMCAFLPAECLHRIPCLFHVWTIRRVHVRHTETMGGLSGVPTAPLHRQYKLLANRTRRHLLLKIGQMPTRPRSAPNLERHGSSKMQTFGWLEMPHFLNRMSIRISI